MDPDINFINTNLLNTNFVLWFCFIANYIISISLYVYSKVYYFVKITSIIIIIDIENGGVYLG